MTASLAAAWLGLLLGVGVEWDPDAGAWLPPCEGGGMCILCRCNLPEIRAPRRRGAGLEPAWQGPSQRRRSSNLSPGHWMQG